MCPVPGLFEHQADDGQEVAVIKNSGLDYCREAPFHPQELYPEYPFREVSEGNHCYRAVRDLLYTLRMDRDNFGKASWNPLGAVIKPGDHVFIKPNFVSHQNKVGGVEAIITHGSVIRALLDYVYIALQGRGHVAIGDAPYIDTDFGAVLKASGVDEIASYYRACGMTVDVIDLRRERGQLKLGRIRHEATDGDPLGYTAVDLGTDSAHTGHEDAGIGYRVAYYDRGQTREHHRDGKHEYLISNSILAADVIVNVPKLKTHAKTGITCALKNMVGINGEKGWLPHHLAGPAERGGDEYCYSDLRKDLFTSIKDYLPAARNPAAVVPLRALQAALFASGKALPFRDNYEAGGWYGNDTLPRTIVDLNRILYYADQGGALRNAPQRRVFTVVDGVVAGEGDGPMANAACRCGVLIAGANSVAVDIVCSAIMGFDYRKITTIKYAMEGGSRPLFNGSAESILVNGSPGTLPHLLCREYGCNLKPPRGWAGHIEIEAPRAPETRPLPLAAGAR